jgi:PAS domain S-box-containing protein
VRVIDVATHLASILLARHRDDQKLMRSEQRFRHIFEHAAVGVGQIESRSGEILRVNRRYCEILGTPEHELRGKTWMELTHPSDLAADEWQMARLLSGEIREFTMEKRLQRGDGSFVWVNLNVSAMWPEGGEPTTHSAVLEDITERKRAEEALRLSEQRFRNLVQTAPFGVLRIDLDGCITFCNSAVSTIYGCAPKDLIGEKIWDLGFEHADRQCMIEHMPARGDVVSPVRNRQPGQGFLVKHRTRDGRTIEVYLDWTFERDRDENIIGRIIVISDVTKRREFERRLEFQADVLNRVSDAIIVTDQRHAVTYDNEAAQRMFEISDQHRSGNTILPIHRKLLLSGSMHPDVIEALQSTGRWQGEMELELDGGEAIVEVKLKRFRSPDSDDRYLLLLLRDISMRKHAELERRQHRDTLAHVTRLSTMGELVAGLAHEVKQPLYAITNYATAASISLRNLEPGGPIEETWLEDLKEFNDGVRRASQRAGEIIQRLREFARKSDQSRETLNLNEVIHDSIDLVAFEARQCDAIVTLQLQEPLPRVLADRVQCEQVIVNLLHNAYEALEKVDPPRRVIVRTRSRGKTVEIEVEDNGPGIAAEEQSRIFEAFCTNKPGGMGMGLAISRTIVEDHGGRLSVESNSRGGATFIVSLPVAV